MYSVLKFGAEWCGPCRKLKEDLERQPIVLDNVEFKSVDVDESEDLVDKFNITNVPAIVITKDDVEVARKVGYPGYDNLLEWIKENTK